MTHAARHSASPTNCARCPASPPRMMVTLGEDGVKTIEDFGRLCRRRPDRLEGTQGWRDQGLSRACSPITACRAPMPSRWFSAARLKAGWITGRRALQPKKFRLTKPLVREVKPHRTVNPP